MLESVEEFLGVYKNRPLVSNPGGMGLNHSWALWFLVSRIQPDFVVESGVWRGHSTWIIEQASPKTQILSFDINLKRRKFTSTKAKYFEMDFSDFDWSGYELGNSLCFFDDHQNALERIKSANWFGFSHVIIEDNWPVGQGDCYSIRHMKSGVGHAHLQMSDNSRGSILQQIKTSVFENLLSRVILNQTLLRKPNLADYSNLIKNISTLQEMPPVFLEKISQWNTEWIGDYKTEPPLRELAPALNEDYSYSYLTYLELKK
jgi:hypothetical protein